MAVLPACRYARGVGDDCSATSPFMARPARRIHGSRMDSRRVPRPKVSVPCGLVVWIWVSWSGALLDFIRAARRTIDAVAPRTRGKVTVVLDRVGQLDHFASLVRRLVGLERARVQVNVRLAGRAAAIGSRRAGLVTAAHCAVVHIR